MNLRKYIQKTKILSDRILSSVFRGVFFQLLINRVTFQVNPYWLYDIIYSRNDLVSRLRHKLLILRLENYGILNLNTKNKLTPYLSIDYEKIIKANEYELKFLISYLNYLGFLGESREILRIYLDKLQQIRPKRLNNNKINQLSQLGNWNRNTMSAEELIKIIKYKNVFSKQYLNLVNTIAIYTGTILDYEKRYNETDQKFSDYVNGKRIAIVGPKIDPTISSEIIDEILNYEIIIVPTYIASNYQNSLYDVNISYYNFKNQELINANNNIIDNLDYIVLKGNNLSDYKSNINYRTAYMSSFPWISGAPNMIQIILFDLMYFNPSKIKIFGIDFFVGEDQYFAGYPSKIDDSIKVSFAEHNPLANLRFVKHLLKHEHIFIDSIGQSVLNMTEIEYLDVIKKRYYH